MEQIRLYNISREQQSVDLTAQVSAKNDVNISSIFNELLTQARLHVMSTATDEDLLHDDFDDVTRPLHLRRRQKQKLSKRSSCHVS
jgi:hypothetical protein